MSSTPSTPGPHRARIERELQARLEASRAASPPAVESPLGLRCRACGDVNAYRAVACRRCGTAFNAEIVWLPASGAAQQESQ